MPIISNTTMMFEGKLFKYQIRVLKDGHFHIKLPGPVQLVLGYAEVARETKKEAKTAWDTAVKKYRATTRKTKKVILYQYEVTAHMYGPDTEEEDDGWGSGWGHCIYKADEISFAHGIALGVQAEVFEEIETTYADGEKVYRYEEVEKNGLPRSIRHSSDDLTPWRLEKAKNAMDWTPEREAFFRDIGLSMEDLILKLNKVLNDKKTLLQLADSGRLALPAPKEDK